ncbi:MAG TPA: hypothetical protein VFQ39_11925 [Longimicrobium sp.]|nr:hypothetical protein [Longimicrobium sp.]
MRRLALLACAVLVACAPRPGAAAGGDPGSDRAAQAERVVGVVSVVGSAPMNVRVQVRPDAGPPVYLAGPLLAEVRRLGGARVEVRGRRAAGGELEVADYDVVSVDGRPVRQGTVERAPDGGLQLRLKSGETVRLQGGTQQLRPGQKVWVQGPGSVTVQTYGIIADG